MAVCKFCGQEIEWVRTEKGFTPVDYDPVRVVEGEGQEIFLGDEGEEIKGRLATAAEEAAMLHPWDIECYWVPHKGTCKGRRRR